MSSTLLQPEIICIVKNDGEKWQSFENEWPSLKNNFYSKIEIFQILMSFSLVNVAQKHDWRYPCYSIMNQLRNIRLIT